MGNDWSAQNTEACDVGSPTWMPFGGTCSDDALGVWLSRHGLELVRSPHKAACSTEDATMALFCKAYKSMIRPFEADLSHGRLLKSLFLLYCHKVPRTHKTSYLYICLLAWTTTYVGVFPAGNVDGARVRVTAPATSGRASEG